MEVLGFLRANIYGNFVLESYTVDTVIWIKKVFVTGEGASRLLQKGFFCKEQKW